MKYGITVPNFAPYHDVRRLAAQARAAEEAGWDGFFLWDHITSQGFTKPLPAIDPWVGLTAIALATERIRLGPMVTPLPRRRPWVVARQTVTLDHLSGGRLILGVGIGFPPDEEYANLGEDPDWRVRGEKLDEALDVLTGLWSGESFSYAGKHYRVSGVTFLPKPLQQPRIPIWVAGMWPNRPPFRRAARYDGAFPIDPSLYELSPEQVAEIRDYIVAHGGSAEGFDIAIGGTTLGQEMAQARATIAPFVDAGATWWIEGPRSMEQLEALIRRGPPPQP